MPWSDGPVAAAPPPPPPEPVRFVVVLAACAAFLALARGQTDPAGAAETRFLALVAGGVLAAIAGLAPRPGRELGWTAVLATTGAWIIGHGPHRGALVTLILTAGLAAAATRAGRPDPAALLAAPGRAVALALGAQVLVRSDLLLPPLLDPRTLVSVLVLPTAVGLALHLLARARGGRAWIAGAAAFVLAPGWNVAVTLALVALAAGAVAARRDLPFYLRAAAAAALLVPPLWNPGLGLLFALGGLTLVVREARASWLIAAAGVGVLVYTPIARGGTELLVSWSLGLALVPAAAAARGGWTLVTRGAFLALVAAIGGGGPEVLAGGLALAALGTPADGAVADLQRAWTNALALATTLLAAYPWLRPRPVATAFELLGLDDPRLRLAAAFLVVLGGGGLFTWLRRVRPTLRPRPVAMVAAAFALALLGAVPITARVPIAFEPVVLSAAKPLWTHRMPAQTIAGGALVTHLVRSVDLPIGTRVATVRLRRSGQVVGTWDLVAGFDTAEWAAARPDVAALPGFRAPSPWLSQVAAAGTFFSQRYLARFSLPRPAEAAVLTVRRNPALPPDVELTIYRLELRR